MRIRAYYFVVGFFLSAAPALATQDIVGSSLQQTGKSAGFPLDGEKPRVPFEGALMLYVNGLATMMGALFLIRTIYAGWLWLSAHGKEDQVEHAKQMIFQGVIGIAVIISARIIVELVITVIGAIALSK
jgi:hypothetical protein